MLNSVDAAKNRLRKEIKRTALPPDHEPDPCEVLAGKGIWNHNTHYNQLIDANFPKHKEASSKTVATKRGKQKTVNTAASWMVKQKMVNDVINQIRVRKAGFFK